MKIRLGFVSNSSSSSFVCDVCGRDDSGWDMTLMDADMKQCVNGHIVCNDHIDNNDIYSFKFKKQQLINKLEKEIETDIRYLKKYTEENSEKEILNWSNYLKNDTEKLEEVKQFTEYDEDELCDLLSDYEFEYNLPEDMCPICLKSKNIKQDPELKEYIRLSRKFDDSYSNSTSKYIKEVMGE